MSTRVNKLPIFIFGSVDRVSGGGGEVSKQAWWGGYQPKGKCEGSELTKLIIRNTS